MQTLHYSIHINAPRQKVWDVMLNDETYRAWTKAFDGSSHFVGDWSEGSKMLFIGSSEDGTSGDEGMVSMIKERREPEFISIQHVGILKNGVEDTTSAEAKKWSPSYENYTFIEKDGGTELLIDVDMLEEYADMFNEMWGKALVLLKDLSE